MVTPTKTKTDTEKLVEEFNQWANERISDYESCIFISLSANHRQALCSRIDTLKSAKLNLERLARGIVDVNSNG